MPKGNPYGQSSGPWMTETKLRRLFAARLSYQEIAEVNFRSEGWKPDRSTVKRKYEAMGMPPRRPSHRDLIPWRIKPEHNSSVLRHMLQAESRSRNHQSLSDADRRLLDRLHELLWGRGTPMVVTYHPEVGFALVLADETDTDIIRPPRTDARLPNVVDEVGEIAS